MTPQRVGADPPQPLVQLRLDTQRSIWQACGIPADIMEGGDGTGTREALRRFLHTTIAPVAQEIQVEASAKLDAPVELTFEALAATDLAGKARAFGSLVMAGMKPEEASKITGFMVGEAAFRQRPAPTNPGQGTKIIGNSG